MDDFQPLHEFGNTTSGQSVVNKDGNGSNNSRGQNDDLRFAGDCSQSIRGSHAYGIALGWLERRPRIANSGERMQDPHGNMIDMYILVNKQLHAVSSWRFLSKVGNDELSHCRLDAVFGLEG